MNETKPKGIVMVKLYTLIVFICFLSISFSSGALYARVSLAPEPTTTVQAIFSAKIIQTDNDKGSLSHYPMEKPCAFIRKI